MSDSFGRTPSTAARPANPDPVRVMVVDDSAVIRGLLTRALEGDPDIRVVTSVGDGQMAVNALQRNSIDVIVLDIEMPVMDGLTAIPKLLAVAPQVKIIMASTLTLRGADISIRCLSAGAADYIPKPTSTREIGGAEDFKRELVSKVKVLGAAARRAGSRSRGEIRPLTPAPVPAAFKREQGPVTLRPAPAGLPVKPDIIAIGSSTGGPQALFEVLSHMKDGVTQPILITQHMPATFTTILAEHISRQCGIDAREAKDGEPIVSGRCYIAPGDFHMLVTQRAGTNTVQLTKDPPENFCRPAVDPMMRSIVRAYGGRKILACILTGMGQDGLKGCTDVVNAGGTLIAQDEASSVVWGMPGAVANAGICSAVLPLKEIGPYIRKFASRAA
ncbi:protein-glutamate methylesterase/protein-glutamine glutaminase [Azospirillum thermophilum]|uniref:Protein-glutamate methylesterase/protein-glutamine glutaminase n=1 Tax=Azospirillum thermophilum TaxID=2202148 RepID=A0A2S2CXK5_9PROT|nr:chemotaxis response regulator protein-glutamate methylesterase [Azospirillum thermophilum]AWK89216.1 chemotaxis response regulator protein-glutamate methylesterase [Azospirillum thermophilum]